MKHFSLEDRIKNSEEYQDILKYKVLHYRILESIKDRIVIEFETEAGDYSLEYIHVMPTTIYEKIENGNEVNLSHCFIKGFSSKNYDKKKPIKHMVGNNAFFLDCEFASCFFMVIPVLIRRSSGMAMSLLREQISTRAKSLSMKQISEMAKSLSMKQISARAKSIFGKQISGMAMSFLGKQISEIAMSLFGEQISEMVMLHLMAL